MNPIQAVWLVAAWAAVLPLAAATGADEPDAGRVAAIAALLPARPAAPGHPRADRAAWDAVATLPAAKGIVRDAEKLLDKPLPELTDEVWLDFSKTGNRTRGQEVIHARHGRLARLVLAECVENRGRFLPAIAETIRGICGEKTWVYPAHDRGLDNFKGKVVQIDLNSSAVSWELAIACAWLGDALDLEVRDLVARELERRTFEPFERHARTGAPKLFWTTVDHNWNAVCHAGVVGAALAAIDSRDRRAWFVATAELRLATFRRGFTPDGYCSEGVGYWNYGFGRYAMLAETLLEATGGRLDLMADPAVKAIALYGRRIEILPGVIPAFADCSPTHRPDPRIMGYCSRRLGLGWKAEERALAATAGTRRELPAFALFGFPAGSPPPDGDDPPLPQRDFFPDAGILVCRPAAGADRPFAVALKGGHNDEHHNHNDVGSYVVALGSATPLLDPGAEVYTAATFGPKRYDSPVLGSLGHPVPLVAGRQQRTGREAAGRIVRKSFTDAEDSITFDLKSCYDVKTLARLERTFTFRRTDPVGLVVVDEVEFKEPERFGTALVTLSPKVRFNDKAVLVGEKAAGVRVDVAAEGAEFRIRPAKLRADLIAKQEAIRVGIDLAEPARKAVITLTIRPQ